LGRRATAKKKIAAYNETISVSNHFSIEIKRPKLEGLTAGMSDTVLPAMLRITKYGLFF